MASLRLLLAIWAAKLAGRTIKALGRRGTHTPGAIALRLCPGLLGLVARPERVVAVTGTNGKTTVSNLVVDALAAEGLPGRPGLRVLHNRFGSNIDAGVATALIEGVSMWGRSVRDVAVLEVDERSARRILPGLRPDLLVCTNLTRDSIKRNAHAEYIAWILTSALPVSTTLVLNADDLIAARLGDPSQPRVLFGVGPQPGDGTHPSGVALDVTICPKCDTTLVWDHWRYNHIGHAHCPACGFASPTPDYTVRDIDADHGRIVMDVPGGTLEARLLNDNIVNVYNQIAVTAVLDRLGMPRERIEAAFDHLQPPATRFSEKTVGATRIVRQLTKGLVGVACSRAFAYIMAMPGSKALVLNIDEVTDARDDVENTAWIYDADYEYLADESLEQVVVGGVRRHDQALRLAIAGVDPDLIVTVPEEAEAAARVDLDGIDLVFNLHSVHNSISTGDVVERTLVERLEAGRR